MILHPHFIPINMQNPLDISLDDLHIWRISLLATHEEVHDLFKDLSVQEQKKALQFRREEDARRYICAHAYLRKILSLYVVTHPKQIVLEEGKYKKPLLKNNPSIQFNMSHSLEMAVFAIAKNAYVGIDIEHKHQINIHDISKMILTESEMEHLQNIPRKMQLDAFYRYWTCKEAYIKAIGMGFYFNVKNIETMLSTDNNIAIKHITYHDNHEDLPAQWHTFSLNLKKDYSSTLVSDRYHKRHMFYELPR